MTIRNLHIDESSLIQSALERDKKAQETLYRNYAPKMLSVCRYYIKDIQYAEDVLMRGFLKAFIRLDQLGKKDCFEAWLRKIITNEALMFLRSKKHLIFLEEYPSIPHEINIPTLNFSTEDIQLWIDQLPDKQKIIFILFAVEGYSHQEISSLLNIPVGTSKAYLSRARNSLQEKIKTYHTKRNEKAKIRKI